MAKTYDEIYGMNLDNYCFAHNTTIENLIQKEKTDIEILMERLKEEYPRGSLTLTDLAKDIHKLINKKKKHLDRLSDWKNQSKYISK